MQNLNWCISSLHEWKLKCSKFRWRCIVWVVQPLSNIIYKVYKRHGTTVHLPQKYYSNTQILIVLIFFIILMLISLYLILNLSWLSNGDHFLTKYHIMWVSNFVLCFIGTTNYFLSNILLFIQAYYFTKVLSKTYRKFFFGYLDWMKIWLSLFILKITNYAE